MLHLPMKAIITAGGRGTRMRPLTFSINKHLIPLANKPLIFYAIETIAKAGIKEIGINYNPGQLEELESVLGDGSKWGVKLTYFLQEKPLGLANIIQEAQDFVGKEKFLMHLGDNIFWGGIKELLDYFLKEKFNALAPVIHHPENWRMGVPYFDKKGQLKRYVEKPKNPPHDLAVPGLYFFDHHVFECFSGRDAIKPSARGEFEIGSLYECLIKKNYRVGTKEFKGVWKDPGKFDDWLDTNQFLLDATVKNETQSKLGKDVKTEGRVTIGKKCKIENSLLRGPIIIGDEVEIKNSFIGPYSSISDQCEILDARIGNSILLKGVKIIHPGKSIDSSLIGQETVIQNSGQNWDNLELFVGNQCIVEL
jgi:glucose-1-phosphate thymidylyltransferase